VSDTIRKLVALFDDNAECFLALADTSLYKNRGDIFIFNFDNRISGTLFSSLAPTSCVLGLLSAPAVEAMLVRYVITILQIATR